MKATLDDGQYHTRNLRAKALRKSYAATSLTIFQNIWWWDNIGGDPPPTFNALVDSVRELTALGKTPSSNT